MLQLCFRLQNSPLEPGCDLPRDIVALMLWSDATVVSQFGGRKVWPVYMYYDCQSKHTRARPIAHAAHHIAYFVPVPNLRALRDRRLSVSQSR